jgi:hypothetical protein
LKNGKLLLLSNLTAALLTTLSAIERLEAGSALADFHCDGHDEGYTIERQQRQTFHAGDPKCQMVWIQ